MHPFDPTLKTQRPGREETGRANGSFIAAARLWPATFQICFDRAARLSHSQWFAVNPDHLLLPSVCRSLKASVARSFCPVSLCPFDNLLAHPATDRISRFDITPEVDPGPEPRFSELLRQAPVASG